MKIVYKIFLIIIFCLSFTACDMDVSLIDKNATKETRILYKNLMEISPDFVLFGHQDDLAYGIGWAYEPGKSDCKITSGSYPAVYGWDIGGLEMGWDKNLDSVPFNKMRNYIIEAFERGSVITISWHQFNPVSGKDSWADTNDTINPTVSKILRTGEFYSKQRDHLNKVADFLLSLKTKEGVPIPIIFRPYHENTGSWFWWGEKHCTETQYKTLFQQTVEYLRDKRDLHNIIYCYSPAAGFKTKKDYLKRYPGDAYTDILGFDHYRIKYHEQTGKEAIISMEIIADLAMEKGKLYAWTETGDYGLMTPNWFTQELLPCLKENEKTRGVSYVMVWRNAEDIENHFFVPYKGHKQENDFKLFRDDELILFEDDIPLNLYK
jgi:mannan endo-1,4-beta-mannosidase